MGALDVVAAEGPAVLVVAAAAPARRGGECVCAWLREFSPSEAALAARAFVGLTAGRLDPVADGWETGVDVHYELVPMTTAN